MWQVDEAIQCISLKLKQFRNVRLTQLKVTRDHNELYKNFEHDETFFFQKQLWIESP